MSKIEHAARARKHTRRAVNALCAAKEDWYKALVAAPDDDQEGIEYYRQMISLTDTAITAALNAANTNQPLNF